MGIWKESARAAALAFSFATALGGAQAQGLIGDEVEIGFAGPNLTLSSTVTVVDGVAEVSCPGSVFCDDQVPAGEFGLIPGESIDIEESSITLEFLLLWTTGQTLAFNSLDLPGGIGGFTLQSNIDWLTAGDISFTTNSLLIDIGQNGGQGTGTAVITLIPVGGTVDEPGVLALAAFGLAGLGFASRRVRRR